MKCKLLVALFSVLFLVACASNENVDPYAAYRHKSQAQIYNQALRSLHNADYGQATKDLEALEAVFPYSPHIRDAQRYVIYAYYMNADTVSAAAAAERYIHQYPRDKHVDYAYYMKGLANFNQYRGFLSHFVHYDIANRDMSGGHAAYQDFLSLVQYFPHSRFAADARQHLVYLRNQFAAHHLQVAQYYYQRRAYVAAANRASEVIEQFPHTPSVESALGLLIRANHALHLDAATADAINILQHNFPQSPVLLQLRRDKIVVNG